MAHCISPFSLNEILNEHNQPTVFVCLSWLFGFLNFLIRHTRLVIFFQVLVLSILQIVSDFTFRFSDVSQKIVISGINEFDESMPSSNERTVSINLNDTKENQTNSDNSQWNDA